MSFPITLTVSFATNQFGWNANLTWTASPNGAKQYTVWRNSAYAPINELGQNLGTTSQLSFVDRVAGCGIYTYVVTATLPGGSTDYSNPVNVIYQNLCNNALTFKLTATNQANGMALSWPATPNTDYALVRYAGSANAPAVTPQLFVTNVGQTGGMGTYIDKTFVPGQNYRVFAYNPTNYTLVAASNTATIAGNGTVSYLETPAPPMQSLSTDGYQLWTWLILILVILLVIWLIAAKQKK